MAGLAEGSGERREEEGGQGDERAQKGKTGSRSEMCERAREKILRQPLIHTRRITKKRRERKRTEKKEEEEEETRVGVKKEEEEKEEEGGGDGGVRHEIQFSRRSQGRT